MGSYLEGAKSFINGSKALNDENYQNLKAQCYFKLAEYFRKNKIYIKDENFKEQIIKELEQVKRKDIDKDGKLAIIGKEIMKEVLGHSPDYADSIMMRMIFELEPKKEIFFA